jgi:hypothetical protein
VRRPLAHPALALAAAVALTAVPAPPAPAKEHTAACAELGGMLARVRSTMKAANSHRLRGSSLAAYQVLQTTTASMARDSGGRRCGALGPTLNAALSRAASSRNALDASLALDQGLEAALSLAGDGRLPRAPAPPKLLPVGEAALYGDGCPDVFTISQRLDGPRGTLNDRVGAVLADLRAHPRCAQVRTVLERAAPDTLAHAVDSIRLDEPERPDVSGDLASRCPELPMVVDHLASAISVGAPLFNAGDAAGCRRTYEAAAAAVAARIVPEGRCPTVRTLLSAGLTRAKEAANDREAAWDLRHSFDAILSEGPDASP